MSDILIKGINLPVGQGVISITIAEDKSVSLATIRRTGGITEILCHTGQGKVVELPPHGRLIDADKLRMKYEYGAERKKVDDASTVL